MLRSRDEMAIVLERLGWSAFFAEQIADEVPPPAVARVIEEQRGAYRVGGDYDGWAEVSGRFRHDARETADFPAVGDWVCLAAPTMDAGIAQGGAPRGDARAIITRRLNRRSTISRKAAGRAVEEQVVAANVDTIFLVTALAEAAHGVGAAPLDESSGRPERSRGTHAEASDRGAGAPGSKKEDLNPRRIERYLTVVREAGAVPVVILNKTDLSSDPESEAATIRTRLPFVDVLGISAKHGEGLDVLNGYLAPGQTVALIGSSGVGKSTLVNRLLGQERLKTASIRDSDGRGRHTTTSRQLVELPGGALLIDTPGMRELQPWVDESAVSETFEDIAELALGCRFSDCAHQTEPGCAVLAAVERGELDPARLEHFRHLGREIAFEERKRDKAAAAAEKKRWKKIHQAAKQLYKERDRL